MPRFCEIFIYFFGFLIHEVRSLKSTEWRLPDKLGLQTLVIDKKRERKAE